MWRQIIGKYPPTYLGECQKAVTVSQQIVTNWLESNMFKAEEHSHERAQNIATWLGTHANSGMHNRHFSADEALRHGLHVEMFEQDDTLQDIILTIYHSYIASLEQSAAIKMIENSEGKAWVRLLE